MNFFYRFDFLAYVRHLNDFQYGIDLRGMSELHATLVLQLYVSWAEERTKKTATMDAIKKKMQAMKMEKDSAMDKADNCEAQAKDANMKADKVRKTIWRGFLTPDITDFRVHIMWIAVPDGRELLRHGHVAARFLGLWVLILSRASMCIYCEYCVSGRGLYDGLTFRPEMPYECVFVCVCHWVWSDATITLYTYSQ